MDRSTANTDVVPLDGDDQGEMSMKKSFAPIALVAALAGGAGALALVPGLAGAQSASSATAADTTGASGPFKSVLDSLVADGTLTQAQADAVQGRLKEVLPDRGKGGHLRGLQAAGADVAAYLGLTGDEIRTALQGGKTLADLAAQEGKTVEGLIDVIVTSETKAIDAAVASGKLTEDRATTIKANLKERTTQMVQNVRPDPGLGGHRMPGGFHGGMRPGAPAGTTTPAA
jgi:polyhydroxyalkanoate synthesis regulator phasin